MQEDFDFEYDDLSFAPSLCDFLFMRRVVVWFCMNGIEMNMKGFDSIDLERIFNHKYFDFNGIWRIFESMFLLVTMVTMVDLVDSK